MTGTKKSIDANVDMNNTVIEIQRIKKNCLPLRHKIMTPVKVPTIIKRKKGKNEINLLTESLKY